TLCQQVALAALRQGNEPFRPIRAEFESRRRYAFERLQTMGLRPAWPAGGVFFWVPVRELGRTGRAVAGHLFRDKEVRGGPGAVFGPGGEGHVRLSYAAEDGRLREGLGRLADCVRQLRGAAPAGQKQAA